MSGPRDCRDRAGFTLIELLVALSLAGLAIALISGSVRAAIDARERQARAAEAEHRTRVTREFLREAVRGVASERQDRGELLLLRQQGPGDDRLVLSTRGGAVFGWGTELKAVELLVDRDAATPHTGLVARVARVIAAGGVAVDTLALIPEVTGLEVRLLDARQGWRDEWPETTRLPAAVEFRFASAAATARPLLALPLQVRVP